MYADILPSVTFIFVVFLFLYPLIRILLGMKFKIWVLIVGFSYGLTIIFPFILLINMKPIFTVLIMLIISMIGAFSIQMYNYYNNERNQQTECKINSQTKMLYFFDRVNNFMKNRDVHGIIWMDRALIYKSMGNMEKALDAFKIALTRSSTNKELIEIEISDIYLLQGKYEESMSILFRLLKNEKIEEPVKKRIENLVLYAQNKLK